MITLPQNPKPTQFAISTWLRKIRTGVQRSQPISGADLNVTETPYGVKFKTKKNTISYVRWLGEFDDYQNYYEGDMVYVSTSRLYNVLDPVTGRHWVRTPAGVYICVYPVPVNIPVAGQFGSIDDYLLNYLNSLNKRVDGIVYAPLHPSPTPSPGNVTANVQGKYWQLLSLTPMEMTVCEDGINTNYYIEGYKSGSYGTPII